MKRSVCLAYFFLITILLTIIPAYIVAAEPSAIQKRVVLQRSIEDVYWKHRLWPAQNSSPKPPLEQVLPASSIEEKVMDALRKSNALSLYWQRAITGQQLQAEIFRMASDTKQPEVLRELWQALGNQPELIAESLARPILVDRLIRNAYNFDERFHGKLKLQITEELKRYRTPDQMRQMSGSYQEMEWIRVDQAAAAESFQKDSSQLSSSQWNDWIRELNEIFNRPSRLPISRISKVQEREDGFYAIAILKIEKDRIRTATVQWQKTSFETWWKSIKDSITAELTEPRYNYKLPEIAAGACANDTWSPMRSVPDARVRHSAVWTGSEMIVWGGILGPLNTGGRYDPATDTWHPIAITNEPAQRVNHTAVWTGTRMVVWGGWGGGTTDNVFNDGGLYDPLTDTWSVTSIGANVPLARMSHTTIWTGTEMIVWGGCPDFGCFSPLNTGGRYNPLSDTWQTTATQDAPQARTNHTAVWTNNEMIVWGGNNFSTELNTGGRYDPGTDSWVSTSTTNAPAVRSLHSAVWDGTEMIVWGGCPESGCFTPLNTGGLYDPSTDSWSDTSITNSPQGRRGHSAIWDGSEMIIFGGCVDHDCSVHVNTGGKYDPQVDAWSATDLATAPSGRSFHTAVWTGSEMIVWAGCVSGECEIVTNTGGRYDPGTDSWIATSLEDAPSKRVNHTDIWTGAEMVVWGGFSFFLVSNGGIYDPATDHWSILLFSNAPGGRDGHTAVWTGTEMIIWGGREIGIGVTSSGGRCNLSTLTCTDTSFTNVPSPRAFHSAVWTGTEMVAWGGCATESCDSFLNSGGLYNPVTDSWNATTQTNAPVSRFANSTVWSGTEMIVWGGFPATNSGGLYDPAANTWLSTTTTGAPSARYRHTGIWTGSEMIVWGGFDGTNLFDDGARYDPSGDSWNPISNVSTPAARWEHTAVWTDSEMIVWGGCSDTLCNTFHLTGGRYNPATDSWVDTNSSEFVPFDRSLHTAVWTGSEMLLWGGWRGSSSLMTNTGSRCCVIPPSPDFSITCNPSSLITLPGQDVTSTCTITSLSNFNDAVALSCANLPPNVTCTFNPDSVTPPPNGSIDSTMTVTVADTVPDGAYSFDAVGTSGILSHSFNMNLTVTSVCTFSIEPPGQTFDETGGTGSVTVTAPDGCDWTAVSNDTWITITGGSSGNGNGTVDYSVDPNPDAAQRIGTMLIATQTFTVTQTGSCLFCDDFEDGVLDPNWNYIKPSWSESGGNLIGTPLQRKAIAIASPVFGGCSVCSVEAMMQTA
ncbi:hypothetical protein L0152_28490, partial [bacterium]|nr:hypothetical protein [bacterium]